jgi:PAS domain S-box-containing protein
VLIGTFYVIAWLHGLPPAWAANGVITMKTNMALAQVLAGGAILVLRGFAAAKPWRAVAIVASAVVLLIGALTLAEYLFRFELGIDQLIATEPLDVLQRVSPNRMGPPGAISLSLIGAGLLALAFRQRVFVVCGVATCCIVLLPAVGYLYGIPPLHGAMNVTLIAWTSVIALLALGVALTFADPDDGSVPVVWRRDPGGVLLRRMLFPVVLLPIVVGFVWLVGERQGLYERHVGTGLFAVTLSVLFFLLLWRSAARLSASAEQRARIEEEAQWRASLLDLAHDAILVWSREDGIESWSRGADELYGYTAFDALGRVSHDLLQTVFPRPWHDIEAVLETSGRWEGELIHRTKAGEEVTVSAKLQVIRGADGRVRVLESSRDVTEAKRAADEVRHSEERARARAAELEAILGCVADGVVVYDEEGRIVRSNAAAEAILRYDERDRQLPAAEWLAMGRYEWLTEDGHRVSRENSPAYRAAQNGETLRGAVLRMRSGDEERWITVSAAPLVVDGERVGAVVSVADTTDRKRAEEQLRDSDRRKNEFLAVLSHELRNPLAPIRNAIHILHRAEDDSEQAARARAVIERQVTQLTRLVEDLLDVTRISRGKIQLHRSRFDLAALVREVVEDHRPLFTAREIDLQVRSSHGELWIDADATRIRQLVGNMLHNAAKFTNAHGHVAVTTAKQPRSQAIIRVADDGIGIGPELLPRVFDPFAQADQALHRSLGGLGLGLALVKGLVEMHEGRVEARSGGPGNGSEFIVSLPLVATASVSPQSLRPGAEASSGSLRILIIEDNLDAADTLKEGLELNGHDVAVTHDGLQGVMKARALRPDVVLCDIGLPGIDGYEVARQLRGDEHLSRLVAITGYASPDDQRRAFKAGFEFHLAKPFSFDELEQVLSNAKAPRRARRILVVEDDDALRANVREILEDEGWTVCEARTASEAERAIEEFAPAVILLDYRLPDVDGGELLRRLGPLGLAPQVVLMTASTHVREVAMKHGLRFYVPKPFSGDELIDTVEHARTGLN